MKKLLLFFGVSMFFLGACSNESIIKPISEYEFVVNGWNTIDYNGNIYTKTDKYNNHFKDYYIFYELNENIEKAYYIGDDSHTEAELKTYNGDIQTDFISQVEHWYSLSDPFIYGNSNNPRFEYLDDYDNVEKISVLITSIESESYQSGEYILSEELSTEVWLALSEMEKERLNSNDIKWKKSNFEAWINLYIKDVNAAVCVGMLCYNTDGELCVSNTNYSKLHSFSSQWQDLSILLNNCEYIGSSILNSY